jgi:hypothetical protein
MTSSEEIERPKFIGIINCMFVGHICKQIDLTNEQAVVQPSPWQNISAISLPLTLHELDKGQLHAMKLLMWHLVNI